jgi:hypothetical protein
MKILFLIPDGVGVRNFIYTDFIDRAKKAGHEIVTWAEPGILSLAETRGTEGIALPGAPYTCKRTEILRKAWQTGLLRFLARKYDDKIYLTYISKPDFSRPRDLLKTILSELTLAGHRSYYSINKLKKRYLKVISGKPYFNDCLLELEKQKPDILFCSHQRALNGIAPIEAAKRLGIPTACFIYSWDNLSKATLFVDSDYYLVWSEYMKRELITYHPEVKAGRIFVTGTPQFVPYFDNKLKISREQFASTYNLPIDSSWICYSGDDTKTSPYDPVYLEQLAGEVDKMNEKQKKKVHIIFRRCPVDKSNRFDRVLEKFTGLITPIDPLWKAVDQNSGWHQVIPSIEDIALLVNTSLHSDMVINVGSTMAFDFCISDRPALFINYNAVKDKSWDIKTIYKFIHFRSMEGLNPVLWVNSEHDWMYKISEALRSNDVVEDCHRWHEKIAYHPLDKANERIIDALTSIKNICTSVS